MNIKKNNRGVSAVEFALILPLLLMVLFMIIEFSIILYDKAVITNASREGARAGIVCTGSSPRISEAAIKTTVNAYIATNLISFASSPTPANITVPGGICGAASGTSLEVDVQYTYGFLVLPNFLNSVIGPMNLTAITVMRCE